MASEQKIRQRIQEIAQSVKNVTLADIEWVMGQLKEYGEVEDVTNDHQKMFFFDGEFFGVCTHHKGSKQLKPVYVKEFLKVMMKTGWL